MATDYDSENVKSLIVDMSTLLAEAEEKHGSGIVLDAVASIAGLIIVQSGIEPAEMFKVIGDQVKAHQADKALREAIAG